MNKRMWLRVGAVAGIVILLALVVYRFSVRDGDESVVDSREAPTESVAPTAGTTDDSEPSPGTETASEADAESVTTDETASEAESNQETALAAEEGAVDSEVAPPPEDVVSVPPSYDIIERTPFGTWVIAGRSSSNAEVEILMDGNVLATVEASPNGDWATVESAAAEPGHHEFTLRATSPDGTVMVSLDPVVLLIPEEFGRDTLSLRVGENEIETLNASDEGLALSIESVSYGEQGAVIVAGRAAVGAEIKAESRPENATDPDSAFLRAFFTEVGDSGKWRGEVKYLPINVPYVIRVTANLPDGGVAQEEIRFMRAIPNLVFDDGSVVVQPGNSLWRIARRVYGRGIRYHIIFEANRVHIDDPDLIYPGQIFQLPKHDG